MKNEQFTEEEIKIVGKAKEQLSNYTTGGSTLGGLVGLALARSMKYKGLQGIAVAAGGVLIGSQVGLVFGAMKSVKTIQTIPNFRRVLNIVQEVREEKSGLSGPGGPRGSGGPTRHDHGPIAPVPGHQRVPAQPQGPELLSDYVVEQQEQHLQAFREGKDGYHGGNDPTKMQPDQTNAWAHAQQRTKEIQSNSTNWNQIRQQNMPKSVWNDIREGRHSGEPKDGDADIDLDQDRNSTGNSNNSPPPKTTTLSGWNRVRQGEANGFDTTRDGPSAFPRTREDLESKPSRQKNQYGDIL